ncbi:MAG: tRNA glutamyl-Q(34) synthetase GluQRS [Pseudomonadota bacterium]|nr:tRNA glutamyl-Q(34) synthetase GluQRS [Pseudomonadota bacterium]
MVETVTRFAPSPNGPLHLGHAYSAVIAHDMAKAANGRFLLRIEDIDGPRSRPEFADEFRRDLEWLGLEWEEVPAQSTRLDSYREAAARLVEEGLLYPCTLTRKQMAQLAFREGADGLRYPGSSEGMCGPVDPATPHALRLDIDAALDRVGELVWTNKRSETVMVDPREFGDVVLVRKDLPASYHLAATLDDAADGVTLVTRGADLYSSTHIHRVLQKLLDLPVPEYFHHSLIMADGDEKLSKSKGAPALADRRRAGEDGKALADQLREQAVIAGT